MSIESIIMAVTPQAALEQKTVTLLGATGTIGQNTLRVIGSHPERFNLQALVASDNIKLLAKQAREHKARRAVIANASLYDDLKDALAGTGIEAAAGRDAVLEAAGMPSDLVMSAIVGAAGLKPTLTAIRRGATVAIANKECLVCAGALVMEEARRHGATLIPVDSEHNGIFQLFDFDHPERIERVTLTASGGPFRSWTKERMKKATPKQAVAHPNWTMGAKISVDSATLMNKGLELIEACHLFPLKPEQVDILIHPQSVVHCLIRMSDGSVLAQMSVPDMCTPIAHALAWPERMSAPVKPLDLAKLGRLEFEAPDTKRFPALTLARKALIAGGSAPCVLNAANEIAVQQFLKGEIGFLDIVKTVEKTLAKMDNKPLETIDDVLACDAEARQFAERI